MKELFLPRKGGDKMKKLFILLGVIMFSILGCSCKSSEQIKYKVSKYNDEINEEILYWWYMETFYPDESILISNMNPT